MASFDNSQIKLDVLKKRAYNYRWAEVDEGVIPLTAADPDYPAAPEIREAMIDYINDGCFSYTPKLGYPEFCESISRALKARKGEDIRPELILFPGEAERRLYRSYRSGKLYYAQDPHDRPVQSAQPLRRPVPPRGSGAHHGSVREI